jgi:hypothetical protein
MNALSHYCFVVGADSLLLESTGPVKEVGMTLFLHTFTLGCEDLAIS